MFASLYLAAGAVAVSAATADTVILASFDGTAATTRDWRDTNDPVMGGASTSTFVVDAGAKTAVFNGTCAIVESLKAPGFAKVASTGGGDKYSDVSKYLDGSMQLYVRSTTPDYDGFRVGWAAPGIPRTSIFGGGTFKAGFKVQGTDWQQVDVPFTEFSYDWSGYTGRCDTKDPNGQQHKCCSDDADVCPTAAFLSTINGLEVWAEGVEGDFHLELMWLGAGPTVKVADKATKATGKVDSVYTTMESI